MNLMKRESVMIEFRGKPLFVELVFEYDFCDSDPMDMMDFETDAEREAYREKFANGTLDNLWFSATARALGCEGSDSISGCHVGSPQDAENCIKENGLKENALEVLKLELENRLLDWREFI